MKSECVPLQGYLVLVMLSTISLVSSDIYLALFSVIAKDLHASLYSVQFSISFYILILGISQLFVGYVLDNFELKRVMAASAIIYIVGCVLCYTSSLTLQFYFGRLFQAVGASVPIVVWQPLTLALYGEMKGRTVGSYLFVLLALSPGLAPFIGMLISKYSDWRVIFIFLAANYVLCALLLCWLLKNTPMIKSSSKITLRDLAGLLRSTYFLSYSAMVVLNYSCYLSFIIAYPSIVGDERDAVGMSMDFSRIAMFFCGGALLGQYFMRKNNNHRAVISGITIFATSAVFLLVGDYMEKQSIQYFLIACYVLVFGSGLMLPAATYEAINTCDHARHSAAGFLGSARMGMAFIVSTLITLVPVANQGSALAILVGFAVVVSIVVITKHVRWL